MFDDNDDNINNDINNNNIDDLYFLINNQKCKHNIHRYQNTRNVKLRITCDYRCNILLFCINNKININDKIVEDFYNRIVNYDIYRRSSSNVSCLFKCREICDIVEKLINNNYYPTNNFMYYIANNCETFVTIIEHIINNINLLDINNKYMIESILSIFLKKYGKNIFTNKTNTNTQTKHAKKYIFELLFNKYTLFDFINSEMYDIFCLENKHIINLILIQFDMCKNMLNKSCFDKCCIGLPGTQPIFDKFVKLNYEIDIIIFNKMCTCCPKNIIEKMLKDHKFLPNIASIKNLCILKNIKAIHNPQGFNEIWRYCVLNKCLKINVADTMKKSVNDTIKICINNNIIITDELIKLSFINRFKIPNYKYEILDDSYLLLCKCDHFYPSYNFVSANSKMMKLYKLIRKSSTTKNIIETYIIKNKILPDAYCLELATSKSYNFTIVKLLINNGAKVTTNIIKGYAKSRFTQILILLIWDYYINDSKEYIHDKVDICKKHEKKYKIVNNYLCDGDAKNAFMMLRDYDLKLTPNLCEIFFYCKPWIINNFIGEFRNLGGKINKKCVQNYLCTMGCTQTFKFLIDKHNIDDDNNMNNGDIIKYDIYNNEIIKNNLMYECDKLCVYYQNIKININNDDIIERRKKLIDEIIKNNWIHKDNKSLIVLPVHIIEKLKISNPICICEINVLASLFYD
jgi:hypothetical protein